MTKKQAAEELEAAIANIEFVVKEKKLDHKAAAALQVAMDEIAYAIAKIK